MLFFDLVIQIVSSFDVISIRPSSSSRLVCQNHLNCLGSFFVKSNHFAHSCASKLNQIFSIILRPVVAFLSWKVELVPRLTASIFFFLLSICHCFPFCHSLAFARRVGNHHSHLFKGPILKCHFCRSDLPLNCRFFYILSLSLVSCRLNYRSSTERFFLFLWDFLSLPSLFWLANSFNSIGIQIKLPFAGPHCLFEIAMECETHTHTRPYYPTEIVLHQYIHELFINHLLLLRLLSSSCTRPAPSSAPWHNPYSFHLHVFSIVFPFLPASLPKSLSPSKNVCFVCFCFFCSPQSHPVQTNNSTRVSSLCFLHFDLFFAWIEFFSFTFLIYFQHMSTLFISFFETKKNACSTLISRFVSISSIDVLRLFFHNSFCLYPTYRCLNCSNLNLIQFDFIYYFSFFLINLKNVHTFSSSLLERLSSVKVGCKKQKV